MKCPICKIRQADSPHHIIPRAQGGSDDVRNEILTCRLCHDELEALAEKGIFCTPTIVRLMQLNEQQFEPIVKTMDINLISHTNLVVEPVKWIPMEELLANLPQGIYKKGGRPRIPDGMPMSRYTKWRRKKEAQGIYPTCGAQLVTKGKEELKE